MGLALQENNESTKNMEAKMDMLNGKFTVYVDTFHHSRFITKDSPHYALLEENCVDAGGRRPHAHHQARDWGRIN